MTSDWILRALGLVAVSILVGSGFWLGTRSLFPRLTERLDQAWRRPIRNTLVGALIGIPIAAAARFFEQQSNVVLVQQLGVLLQGLLLIAGVVGLTGLASRIGHGLKVAGEERYSWKSVLRGGIVIGLVTGLPWGGGSWGVLVLLAGGLGCLVMKGSGQGNASGRGAKARESNRPNPRGPGNSDDRRGGTRPPRSGRRNRPPREREERNKGRSDIKKGAEKSQ